jgi:hypothetical protein
VGGRSEGKEGKREERETQKSPVEEILERRWSEREEKAAVRVQGEEPARCSKQAEAQTESGEVARDASKGTRRVDCKGEGLLNNPSIPSQILSVRPLHDRWSGRVTGRVSKEKRRKEKEKDLAAGVHRGSKIAELDTVSSGLRHISPFSPLLLLFATVENDSFFGEKNHNGGDEDDDLLSASLFALRSICAEQSTRRLAEPPCYARPSCLSPLEAMSSRGIATPLGSHSTWEEPFP